MKKKNQPIGLTQDEKIQLGRYFGLLLRHFVNKKFGTEKNFLLSTGIKERQYYKLLKGGNPTLQTIYLYAKALEIHPRELLASNMTQKIYRPEDFGGWDGYQKFMDDQKSKTKSDL